MVSTRASTRASSAAPDDSPGTPRTTSSRTSVKKRATGRSSASSSTAWTHTPTRLTLFWLLVSLPLVIWDTVYVLGRPHTMEGGKWYWPMYVPYKLYGTIDYVYGIKAYKAKSGFTAAQGTLNAVETVLYLAYLYIYIAKAKTRRGARRSVRGRAGALATLFGFSSAVMTLSKTILYWLNEYYSGYANIGHNTTEDLIYLWIIPNGAWILGSAYMTFSIGKSIFDGLVISSSTRAKAD